MESETVSEMFHAHVDEDTRSRVMTELPKVDSVIRVLVCYIAFGMGIDIPDVRVVVLWGLPKNMLDYWQETGRCCRDKKLTGVSICYVYRSSFQTCTDVCLKNVAKGTGCIQEGILSEFFIEGMEGVLQEKTACDGNCDTKGCVCGFCQCCDGCLLLCTCPQKVEKEKIPADFLAKLTDESIQVSSQNHSPSSEF